LLEIIVVLLIVLILAAFLLPNYPKIIGAVQKAVCVSNMRSIHVGLSSYLQDHRDVWPQGPAPEEERAWENFWVTTLEQQGVAPRTWRCPAISARISSGPATPDGGRPPEIAMHYAPTMFDATRGIARRWTTQPWLIERADVHGAGPLICFPDGSVKDLRRVLAERPPQPQ
jgi:type II secretory pathway pseudopilin PulG